MFHELIHYAYKHCITNTVLGEERTNARNIRALLIEVRIQKKDNV
jgi:hypothetical protein